MAVGFEQTDAGRFVAVFDEAERNVLKTLAADLIGFVGPEESETEDPFGLGILEDAEISDDPALARLFPHAYRSDYEAATDFRRFTEVSIREAKAANLRTMADAIARSGDKCVLSAQEAQAWLSALNDIRLVIGTRLGLGTDEEPDRDDIEPEYLEQLDAIYQWLTWLQESLVEALLGEDDGTSIGS